MAMLGVPYGDAVNSAPPMARAQADAIAAASRRTGGPAGLADKEIVALIAYLQRLGHATSDARAARRGVRRRRARDMRLSDDHEPRRPRRATPRSRWSSSSSCSC